MLPLQYMNRIITFITILTLSVCIEFKLRERRTCMHYEVKEENSELLFSFHYALQQDSYVNLIVYGLNKVELAHTDTSKAYEHILELSFQEVGVFEMCFVKQDTNAVWVHFDIMEMEHFYGVAGNDDINRLSQRLTSTLVELSKVTLEFKEVLTQVNERHDKLRQAEESYFFYAMKSLAMLIVMVLQILVVKQLYD